MSSLLRCRCNWVNLFPWVWLVAVPPPPWMIRSGYYGSFLLLVLLCLLCGILQGILWYVKLIDLSVVQHDLGSGEKRQDLDGGPPLEEFLSVFFIQEHELLSHPGDGGVSRGLAETPFYRGCGAGHRGKEPAGRPIPPFRAQRRSLRCACQDMWRGRHWPPRWK